MSDQMRVAMVRGGWQAFLQFGGVFFATYVASDDLRASILGASLAAFVALGYRGVGEGRYDTVREEQGRVRDSDVRIDPMNPKTW